MNAHGIILGLLTLTSSVWAVDYATQIKPLLKQKAGLRLDTVQLLLKGGESGSAAKLIIERVTAKDEHERMPPCR